MFYLVQTLFGHSFPVGTYDSFDEAVKVRLEFRGLEDWSKNGGKDAPDYVIVHEDKIKEYITDESLI